MERKLLDKDGKLIVDENTLTAKEQKNLFNKGLKNFGKKAVMTILKLGIGTLAFVIFKNIITGAITGAKEAYQKQERLDNLFDNIREAIIKEGTERRKIEKIRQRQRENPPDIEVMEEGETKEGGKKLDTIKKYSKKVLMKTLPLLAMGIIKYIYDKKQKQMKDEALQLAGNGKKLDILKKYSLKALLGAVPIVSALVVRKMIDNHLRPGRRIRQTLSEITPERQAQYNLEFEKLNYDPSFDPEYMGSGKKEDEFGLTPEQRAEIKKKSKSADKVVKAMNDEIKKREKAELSQYYCGIESKKPKNKVMGTYDICAKKNQIRHWGEKTKEQYMKEVEELKQKEALIIKQQQELEALKNNKASIIQSAFKRFKNRKSSQSVQPIQEVIQEPERNIYDIREAFESEFNNVWLSLDNYKKHPTNQNRDDIKEYLDSVIIPSLQSNLMEYGEQDLSNYNYSVNKIMSEISAMPKFKTSKALRLKRKKDRTTDYDYREKFEKQFTMLLKLVEEYKNTRNLKTADKIIEMINSRIVPLLTENKMNYQEQDLSNYTYFINKVFEDFKNIEEYPPVYQETQFPPLYQEMPEVKTKEITKPKITPELLSAKFNTEFPPLYKETEFPPLYKETEFPPLYKDTEFPPLYKEMPEVKTKPKITPELLRAKFNTEFPPLYKDTPFPPLYQQYPNPADLKMDVETIRREFIRTLEMAVDQYEEYLKKKTPENKRRLKEFLVEVIVPALESNKMDFMDDELEGYSQLLTKMFRAVM
jgi:hypothetical protein